MREVLVTGEDVARFDAQNQACQVYHFDRVINEMYTDYATTNDEISGAMAINRPAFATKFYSKVIR